jgi:diguanylate cyclase (GGDEF)-like protein
MRTWTLATGATLLTIAFVGVLQLGGLPDDGVTLLSNLGQLLAAALAAAGCAVAARRSDGHRSRAWWWLAAGTGSWAAGQAVWSFYEVVLGEAVPFPSAADVGFLTFPVLAAVGLVVWLGTQSDQLVARGRDLMDGGIIAGSLLVLSWVTTMGQVVAGGADSWFPLALSLAYPVGDVVLATLVLIILTRGLAVERTTLVLLALGLLGFALADSAFVYLTSRGVYSSADLVSSGGWVAGFLFTAVAGASVSRSAERGRRLSGIIGGPVSVRLSWLRLTLPYVPLLAAGVMICVTLLRIPSTPRVDLLLGVILVSMVLTRQFLAMADNQRLLMALAEARDQLEHQALHDALTGLPNRVLFADRLDHALLQPSADVSVLFCDLDDFKLVNDELGHEAGDALLRIVSRRLLDCVRVTDTVSRLGGDEFAILLDASVDARQVADRVVASMQEETEVLGRRVRTSISVGIAHHHGVPALDPAVDPLPGGGDRRSPDGGPLRRTRTASSTGLAAVAEREATAALLLRLADTAMYAAKGAGKSRAVTAPESPRA